MTFPSQTNDCRFAPPSPFPFPCTSQTEEQTAPVLADFVRVVDGDTRSFVETDARSSSDRVVTPSHVYAPRTSCNQRARIPLTVRAVLLLLRYRRRAIRDWTNGSCDDETKTPRPGVRLSRSSVRVGLFFGVRGPIRFDRLNTMPDERTAVINQYHCRCLLLRAPRRTTTRSIAVALGRQCRRYARNSEAPAAHRYGTVCGLRAGDRR